MCKAQDCSALLWVVLWTYLTHCCRRRWLRSTRRFHFRAIGGEAKERKRTRERTQQLTLQLLPWLQIESRPYP